MEAHERSFVLECLQSSREKVRNAVNGLTPDQWTFRPSEDCWSIADCLEHLVIVEQRVLRSIGKVIQRPPEPEKKALVAGKDEFLLQNVAQTQNGKLKAPEIALPKQNWSEIESLLNDFENARVETIRFATQSTDDLRSRFFQHVMFGDLDCYQWLMLIPLHCERHASQMEDIKAEPAFPR